MRLLSLFVLTGRLKESVQSYCGLGLMVAGALAMAFTQDCEPSLDEYVFWSQRIAAKTAESGIGEHVDVDATGAPVNFGKWRRAGDVVLAGGLLLGGAGLTMPNCMAGAMLDVPPAYAATSASLLKLVQLVIVSCVQCISALLESVGCSG